MLSPAQAFGDFKLLNRFPRQFLPKLPIAASRQDPASSDDVVVAAAGPRRRELLLRSVPSSRAEEKAPEPPAPTPPRPPVVEKKEEEILSRVYDATAIGEPQAVGKDKRRVWEKLLGARVVYLGEAELVPDKDDRDLELEIVKSLRSQCLEMERPVSLALEAFPCNIQ